MGPNLSMLSKTSIYFTKNCAQIDVRIFLIRCINKSYYNAHTERLFIRNKILKLDDLYKFELSKKVSIQKKSSDVLINHTTMSHRTVIYNKILKLDDLYKWSTSNPDT